MKVCPRCQKTYNDENLNFCLDDGAVLMQSSATADNSIPATVLMNQTRPTVEPQQFGNQGASQPTWNMPQQQNQFSMQPPPKKSKTWLWVVGILGGLMLLCGGGFVGLIFLGASIDNSNNGNRTIVSNTSNYNSSVSNIKSNSNVAWNGGSTSQTIDLSRWVKGDTDMGNTEYTGGELLMSSEKKNYYYVIPAPAINKTENATTKVTVRNVDEGKTNLGFGLIVNSNPIPLTQDYAFSIDSESRKYRVVRHTPGDEIVVVGWTRSDTIKDGDAKNTIEVRDTGKTMNLYINGEFVRTVGNTDGFAGGVAGLYVSDAVQVAFSDLQISK